MFCRSLFVILSLYCLSFFDIRLLTTFWYIQTFFTTKRDDFSFPSSFLLVFFIATFIWSHHTAFTWFWVLNMLCLLLRLYNFLFYFACIIMATFSVCLFIILIYKLHYIILWLVLSSKIYIFILPCNLSLSPLKLGVRIPLMARCTRYNIMWYSLSVTCDRSANFLRVLRFPPSIKSIPTI